MDTTEAKKAATPARAELERWEDETLSAVLEKTPERKASFEGVSLEPVDRLYTEADLENTGDVGFPGEYPYKRGIHPTGYRGKLWTMRQFAGFSSPEETNRRFKYLMAQGQTGLSVAYDLPALMGLDCDSPLSEGEVGKCGVAVSSLADFEVLFDGIPLDQVTVSQTINAPAPIFLAMYLVVAEKQKADFRRISGTLQNDILKEYIAQKEWIFPIKPAMKLVIDTFEYTTQHGGVICGATTVSPSSWQTVDMLFCSQISERRPATAKSFSMPAICNGATKCKMTLRGASNTLSIRGSLTPSALP